MENWFKWLVSIIGGAIAAFFQQYGLFIVLVAVAVVMDFITGVIKSKATGEGLSSKRAWQGFWKKGSTVCRPVVWDFLGLCGIDGVCRSRY